MREMKFIVVSVPGRVMPGHRGDEVVAKLGGYDAIEKAHKGEEILALNLSVNPDRGYITATRNTDGKPCSLLARVRRWSDGRVTTEIIGLELGKDAKNIKSSILPPYFTKLSSVANLFKESMSTASSHEKREKEQETNSMNPVVQFEQKNIPTVPLNSALCSTPDSMLMSSLEVLFNKRPVWLRASLDEHLPKVFSNWKKRIAFSRTCYLFSDGPWRGCMCKLGYDPRDDPSSRIYQIIDYRDPYYRTISWKTEKPSTVKQDLETETMNVGVDSEYQAIIDQLKNFNPEVHFLAPPSRQSQLYQLCDIFDAGIQKILNENKEGLRGATREACSKTTGWYSQATLSKVRDMMNVKSLRMRQNMNTSNLV